MGVIECKIGELRKNGHIQKGHKELGGSLRETKKAKRN
jgi:hypothetical protein